jgi:hypothetical protein
VLLVWLAKRATVASMLKLATSSLDCLLLLTGGPSVSGGSD